MKPVIEVSGLSKKYEISHQTKAYGTIKDNFANLLKKPFGKDAKDEHETFWALKDVSFEVAQGEIFGIVGRNGSGKSTLLKVLSRIIEPTEGRVVLRGRTASLLEVGTGFHPELSGRENIYFNGSMLGMSRQEINNRFQEIVDFSEIEKFLDTPVKFYSSGMYVRLAFSVAAHLEPDILILDEVLSVGDSAFQKKSLKKIVSTMENGSTVLFVSHGMESVQKLCSRGLLLENGEIKFIGKTDKLIDQYDLSTSLLGQSFQDSKKTSIWERSENSELIPNDYIEPLKLEIVGAHGKSLGSGTLDRKEKYSARIHLRIKKTLPAALVLGFSLYNENRQPLVTSFATDDPISGAEKIRIPGDVILESELPISVINNGSLLLGISGYIYNMTDLYPIDLIGSENTKPLLRFEIEGSLGKSHYSGKSRSGLLISNNRWKVL